MIICGNDRLILFHNLVALTSGRGWGLTRPSYRPQLALKGWKKGENMGGGGVCWLPSVSRGPVQSAVIEIDWMLFFLLQM